MKIDPLDISLLVQRKREFDRARTILFKLKEELIAEYCPQKIGDRVVSNYGYSNEGKPMIIDRIVFDLGWIEGPAFICKGSVINKGTNEPGRLQAQFKIDIELTENQHQRIRAVFK